VPVTSSAVTCSPPRWSPSRMPASCSARHRRCSCLANHTASQPDHDEDRGHSADLGRGRHPRRPPPRAWLPRRSVRGPGLTLRHRVRIRRRCQSPHRGKPRGRECRTGSSPAPRAVTPRILAVQIQIGRASSGAIARLPRQKRRREARVDARSSNRFDEFVDMPGALH
jgi:hypothetical protein